MGTAVMVAEPELKDSKFESLALSHIDSLYRFAMHMAGNEADAQDLVQDTYLKAYRFFDKFEEGTNCKAWLFRIMKNTFINTMRRDKKHSQMISLSDIQERGMEPSVDGDPEDNVFGDLFGDDVSAAIESMPDVYRDVVLMADVEELSYKEISEIIGCPIGTVMSRLCRGRKWLRKRLHPSRKRLNL